MFDFDPRDCDSRDDETAVSCKLSRAIRMLMTRGRSAEVPAAIRRPRMNTGEVAVKMAVGRIVTPAGAGATATSGIPSHATYTSRAVWNEKSFAIVTASTPSADRSRARLRPSARFGLSPVVISGITTIARPIHAPATCGISANRG